jgi:hypothetical protein
MGTARDSLLTAFLHAPFDKPEPFGDNVFSVRQRIPALGTAREFIAVINAAAEVKLLFITGNIF